MRVLGLTIAIFITIGINAISQATNLKNGAWLKCSVKCTEDSCKDTSYVVVIVDGSQSETHSGQVELHTKDYDTEKKREFDHTLMTIHLSGSVSKHDASLSSPDQNTKITLTRNGKKGQALIDQMNVNLKCSVKESDNGRDESDYLEQDALARIQELSRFRPAN